MENVSLTNSSSFKPKELEGLVKKLTKLFMVDFIFLNSYVADSIESHELLILISNKYAKAPNELKPKMDLIFAAHGAFSYRLFQVHQVKEAIDKGNLFFYMACTHSRQVYAKPETHIHLKPTRISLEQVLQKTSFDFQQNMEKAQAFKEGADFYFEKENYAQATFMLQQCMEMIFRAVELLLMGKDKKTHSIRAHQKYIGKHVPVLSVIFPENDSTEATLLDTLDEAYLAVRYAHTYLISPDLMNLFFKRTADVHNIALKIHQNLIAAYTEYKMVGIEKETNAVQKYANENEAVFSDVIQQILECIPVTAVYFLGNPIFGLPAVSVTEPILQNPVKAGSGILLVITPLHKYKIGALHKRICTSGTALVLLLHAASEFYNPENQNAVFFKRVRKSSQLLHQGPTFLTESSTDINSSGSFQQDSVYLTELERKAHTLYVAAGSLIREGVPDAALFMMRKCLEAICLKFIYTRLDYHSNYCRLPHLIALCNHLDNSFPQFFMQHTKQVALLLGKGKFKKHTIDEVAKSEMEQLYQNCLTLLTYIEK